MAIVTYTSSTDVYKFSVNGYSLTNNVWYPNLVDGTNYWTSVTFNPTDVQIGANFSWTLPSNGGGTLAMPVIMFDTRAAGVSTTQVANIAALSVNYTVNLSDMKDSTTAFDLWFTSVPNGSWQTTTDEILIEVHSTAPGTFNQPFTITDPDFKNVPVYVASMSGSGANWNFIDIKTPTDMMSGTLDPGDIIKTLIENGVLTGQEYLSSIQLGPKCTGGSGNLSN